MIGRTDHTGRKGEALVAAVLDIPGIEWHFTGSGWPGPSQFISEAELPNFYRTLDYVLIPSLIEGGPMCVIEALACGCKVIAAPVGWVPQFPHIEFKLGDAEDLRRVLMNVVEEKAVLRRSVETYTWEAFAQQHHQLFTQLLGYDPLLNVNQELLLSANELIGEKPLRAIVAVHGSEMTSDLGGPSVRAPRTAAALRRLGVNAEFIHNRKLLAQKSAVDVVHVFNVWGSHSCEVLLRQIEKQHCPIVFSPIYLDLSEHQFFARTMSDILIQSNNTDEVYSALSVMRENIAKLTPNYIPPDYNLLPGMVLPDYFAIVRRLTTYADHLIVLSEHERKLLMNIGVQHPSISVIKNPVEATIFHNGDPTLFREKFGISDYVLCVARIETRKNQALLALALCDTDIPVVFVGHAGETKYAELVHQWSNAKTIFTERLEPNSAMLASAYAGARVFCLPSWSEGAPLVALEAAAAGCNMVLSNRSAEREYFGDLARYVDPADPNDIRNKILTAYNEDSNTRAIKSQQLQELMLTEHNWEHYAQQTREAYLTAQTLYKSKQLTFNAIDPTPLERSIFFDVTTTAYHRGSPTGIARTEDRIVHELAQCVSQLRYIVWNQLYRKFIEVQKQHIDDQSFKDFHAEGAESLLMNPNDKTAIAEINFKPGDLIVSFGGTWFADAPYWTGLLTVKSIRNVTIVTTIHDIIPYTQPRLTAQWFSRQFSTNLIPFVELSDFIFTCSKYSLNDLVDVCLDKNLVIPPTQVLRWGDEAASNIDLTNKLQVHLLNNLQPNPRFVLMVSSIEIRKNQWLAIELWQRLISEYGESAPILIFVGRLGPGGQDIIDFLRMKKSLQNKILWLQNINDVTLNWLYEHCLFTVYPSLYEGWGLPIAESLMHGKLCIASDKSSLPEVGPGCAEYINPLDFTDWYRALIKYCFTPQLLAQKNQYILDHYKVTKWSDTAKQVLTALQSISATKLRLLPLNIGDSIDFRDQIPGQTLAATTFQLGGWHPSDKRGTWTDGTRAILGLQLNQQPTHPIALCLDAQGYTPDNIPTQVTVVANGNKLTDWSVDALPSILYAQIPLSITNASNNLCIELLIANPRIPHQFDSTTADKRLLGIQVTMATLQLVTELTLDTWNTTATIESNECLVYPPIQNPQATYIGLEIDMDATSTLEVQVNSKKVGIFLASNSKQFVKLIRYPTEILQQPKPFPIKLLATGAVQPRITKVRLFTQPPLPVLLQLLQQHPAYARRNQRYEHVPYTGIAPTITIGNELIKAATLELGLVGGWHGMESHGVWSNGEPASIYVTLNQASMQHLIIGIHFGIYTWFPNAKAHTFIKIGTSQAVPLLDDTFAEFNNWQQQREFKLTLAEAIDATGRLAITFVSNGAIVPWDVGDMDLRPLAIRLAGITIQNAS